MIISSLDLVKRLVELIDSRTDTDRSIEFQIQYSVIPPPKKKGI